MAKDKEIYYCTMQLSPKCKKNNGLLDEKDFYSTANEEFFHNKKLPICKHCLKKFVYEDKKINLDKFKNILQIYDIPFYEKEWNASLNGSKEVLGSYMRIVYLNYKDKHWKDGDIIDKKLIYDEEDEKLSDIDLINRWGFGFTEEELQWLENDYCQWTTHHDCEKLSIQRLVQMICIKELEIRKARQNGKSTDKLEKSLRELMNDSNLTPKTMSAMNESESTKMYSQWIKDIEQYRPAEYFKDKSLYEDFDGIKEYFERFILRPMKNLLTGTREFDKEFSVEEGEEE
ncbi:TPA: hypothetical protein ACH354_002248 [Clostridium perfringens]|uniref:hypothetical protein n=1 Tax=Clostridium perfringens TaxID=1502 RepID=UPI0013E2A0BF|nr:hypothetical protein [Clostridium perfringens]NGS95852.1 hypothetical protein [Clostridium perfringens]